MDKVKTFLLQYAIGVVKALITVSIGVIVLSIFPPMLVFIFLTGFVEFAFLGALLTLAVLVRFNAIQWLGAATPFVMIFAIVAVDKNIKHNAAALLSLDHKIERTIGKIDVLAVSSASSTGYGLMAHALSSGLADSALILTRYKGIARAGNLPPSGHHWKSRKYELVDVEKCTFTYESHDNYEPVRYGNNRLNSHGVFDRCIALTETKAARDVWSLVGDAILIRREQDDDEFPNNLFNDPEAGLFQGLAAHQVLGGQQKKELARLEYVESEPEDHGHRTDPKTFLEALTGLTSETSGIFTKRTAREACLYQLELLKTISIYPDGSVGYVQKSANKRWHKSFKPTTDRVKVDNETLEACGRLRDAVCLQGYIPEGEAKNRCLGIYDTLFERWLSRFPQHAPG